MAVLRCTPPHSPPFSPPFVPTPLSFSTSPLQFFAKFLRSGYGATEEQNVDVAGRNFYLLLTKLQGAGERSDVVRRGARGALKKNAFFVFLGVVHGRHGTTCVGG
jgi:hypothetical protein